MNSFATLITSGSSASCISSVAAPSGNSACCRPGNLGWSRPFIKRIVGPHRGNMRAPEVTSSSYRCEQWPRLAF